VRHPSRFDNKYWHIPETDFVEIVSFLAGNCIAEILKNDNMTETTLFKRYNETEKNIERITCFAIQARYSISYAISMVGTTLGMPNVSR
jgi:hypothetical protein